MYLSHVHIDVVLAGVLNDAMAIASECGPIDELTDIVAKLTLLRELLSDTSTDELRSEMFELIDVRIHLDDDIALKMNN